VLVIGKFDHRPNHNRRARRADEYLAGKSPSRFRRDVDIMRVGGRARARLDHPLMLSRCVVPSMARLRIYGVVVSAPWIARQPRATDRSFIGDGAVCPFTVWIDTR
jgi:hypothetical protein